MVGMVQGCPTGLMEACPAAWDPLAPLRALGAWELWFPAASARSPLPFLLCTHPLAASYLGRAKMKLETGLGLVWGAALPLLMGAIVTR